MIDPPTLVWGAANWLAVAAVATLVLLVLLIAGYRGAGAASVSPRVRVTAFALKVLAILLLATCLLEPLFRGQRARPGANKFAILADNSQSMTLKDQNQPKTRAQELQALTQREATWIARVGRDFDLRQFSFDSQLHSAEDLAALPFDGRASDLGGAVQRLQQRYQGQPLAGVAVLTDGNATDSEAVDRYIAAASAAGSTVPPIYPVLIGGSAAPDVGIERVAVSQTNFEDAPVTLTAQVTATGAQGRMLAAELLDQSGKKLERQQARVEKDGQAITFRFLVKPEVAGVSFFKVRAALEDEFGQFDRPADSTEATLANNTRLAAVNRGQGPYKVLYVAGRLNWEFKFLQRALSSDEQVQLTGLLRVARREPKFNFISRDSTNPLFRGFDPEASETVEQFDQPIIMRVTGSGDLIEPRAKFPLVPEELYAYHAVIIDDVESEFFTPEQMRMLKEFVRQRGGGLLMLGGQETFHNGKYDRTPIGDVLPVYFDEIPALPESDFRLALTREGWLDPWLRLRPDETAENRRLSEMPPFHPLNAVRGIKPGATVLARAVSELGLPVPALVEQRYGEGRSVALLITNLWTWQMRKPANVPSDFDKAWRQTIRWLVSDVPQRVDVTAGPSQDPQDPPGSIRVVAQVRNELFEPQDNATVKVKVTLPDNSQVDLRAEPGAKPGHYEALYVPRLPGAFRAEVLASGPDGSDLGTVAAGWTSDPAADEFRVLQPNLALLERLARGTGGQVIRASNLDAFAAGLPTQRALITEPYVKPFWHQSWIFLIAIACLAAEWGLRRWKGLP